MPKLRDRVKLLIDGQFKGSVNRAAGVLDIPQPTLQRIVDGRVEHPRSDALEKLAIGFGVSMDWLQTGHGEGPSLHRNAREYEQSFPMAAYHRYHKLVMTLPQSAARGALLELPFATGGLVGRLQQRHRSNPAFAEATRLEVEAWTVAIEELIRILGLEGAVAFLEEHLAELQIGFSIVGTRLIWEKLVSRETVAVVATGDVDERVVPLPPGRKSGQGNGSGAKKPAKRHR